VGVAGAVVEVGRGVEVSVGSFVGLEVEGMSVTMGGEMVEVEIEVGRIRGRKKQQQGMIRKRKKIIIKKRRMHIL